MGGPSFHTPDIGGFRQPPLWGGLSCVLGWAGPQWSRKPEKLPPPIFSLSSSLSVLPKSCQGVLWHQGPGLCFLVLLGHVLGCWTRQKKQVKLGVFLGILVKPSLLMVLLQTAKLEMLSGVYFWQRETGYSRELQTKSRLLHPASSVPKRDSWSLMWWLNQSDSAL